MMLSMKVLFIYLFIREKNYNIFFYETARRKKGGKGGGMMMYAAMGLATVLGQVFLGKLALVSGAALMIAKISLLLALLVRYFI